MDVNVDSQKINNKLAGILYGAFTGACCNGDSDYCADYVSSMNSCENWEIADNEQYRN